MTDSVRAGIVGVVGFLSACCFTGGIIAIAHNIQWGMLPFCIGVGGCCFSLCAALALSYRR